MKRLLIAAVAVVAMSCGASKDKAAMATWPGHPKTELIEKWGAPTQTFDNGEKGEIMVYDKTTYNIYKQPLRKKSFQFYVSKAGIIDRYLISYK
jgi:hypothetical protein